MTRFILLFCCTLTVIPFGFLRGQSGTPKESDGFTFGIGGAISACAIRPGDIVKFWNAFGETQHRTGDWILGGEYTITSEFRLSERTGLALEYSRLFFSDAFDDPSLGGHYEYDAGVHMPSVCVQYLIPAPTYIFKLGIGAGYYFCYFDFKGPVTAGFIRSTADGPGFQLTAEGQTAFGEHLYLKLEGKIRYSLAGELKGGILDNRGASVSTVSFNFISAGAGLGLVWYF